MKILIYGLNYWPELIGVGKYTGELAEWLGASGHELRVVTAFPYYPSWRIGAGYRGAWYRRERHAGVEIYRCPLWVPKRVNGWRRVLHLMSFAATGAPVACWTGWAWRPDIVIGVAPTLFAAPGALAAAWLAGARSWLHVQDFEIDAAIAVGLFKGSRLAALARRCERWLLRRFHRVSSISEEMCAGLAARGVEASRVRLVPNWIAPDAVYPLPAPSPLRAELAIAPSTIVALYAGNMNEKQGLEKLVDAARRLAPHPEILIILAGNGPARARLDAMAAGLGNLRFLPLQPADRLNDLLNLADIHLLPQRLGTSRTVMPSKMIGMMASARPLVVGADPLSSVGRLASCCGIIVPPEDGGAMARAILDLAGDENRRLALGAAGRKEILSVAGRETVLPRFVAWLEELAATEDSRSLRGRRGWGGPSARHAVSLLSSCPDLIRASTPFPSPEEKPVDGRIKSGHDDQG